MNIIKQIFIRSKPNFSKLIEYGFIKQDNVYTYAKSIMNNDFLVIVKIDNNNISSTILDNNTQEQYLNIDNNSIQGPFINELRDNYQQLLIDIRNNCFETDNFINAQTKRIIKYILDKYHDKPEFLWDKYPNYGVFRNKKNKWYAIIMDVDKSKISNNNGLVEIINLKLEEKTIKKLLNNNGYYPAYHMNKKHWITITLDDTIKDQEIIKYLNISYQLVNNK